jgi:FkbM family methyltransferase
MRTRPTRRAISDVTSVWQNASAAAATRWTISLAAHLPECVKERSLIPADRSWSHAGACFRKRSGTVISLPGDYTSGAREMYCRDVYLRTGLTMPTTGWVVDLGANRGLFSVWAAVTGAQVVAIEAQEGFGPLIHALAHHNSVAEQVHIEIALASGVCTPGAAVGVVADDSRWARTTHGATERPADVSMPQLMSRYMIDNVRLLKVDIEGGEFGLLAADEDLSWLEQVDQIAMELHPLHGDTKALINRLRKHGFHVELNDNDGHPVVLDADDIAYAYCRKQRVGSKSGDMSRAATTEQASGSLR